MSEALYSACPKHEVEKADAPPAPNTRFGAMERADAPPTQGRRYLDTLSLVLGEDQ